MTKVVSIARIMIILTMISSCMMWRPNWQVVPDSKTGSDIIADLKTAEQISRNADSKSSLFAAIKAYEDVLGQDPTNYRALTTAGNLFLLMGDAYCIKISEKKSHFHRAIIYAEQAMYTNPKFKTLIDQGETTWEACRVLTEREMDAMAFWVTAVFYYYKECLGVFGQIINFRWIKHAKQVLKKMEEIDPTWGGGMIYFSWGIYYLSIPEAVGGDRQKSADYLQMAIDTNPNLLLNRWGRGRYYHIKMKNREAFIEDMEWVLQQDASRIGGHPAWNAYFQRDAREKLKKIDQYF